MGLIWVPDDSAAGQELFVPVVGRDPVRGLVTPDTSGGAGFAVAPTVLYAGTLNIPQGQGRWVVFQVGAATRINRGQMFRNASGLCNWAAGIFDFDVDSGLMNPISVTDVLTDGAAGQFVSFDLPEVILSPENLYFWSVVNTLSSFDSLGVGTAGSTGGAFTRCLSRAGMNYPDWNEPQNYFALTAQTVAAWGRGWAV